MEILRYKDAKGKEQTCVLGTNEAVKLLLSKGMTVTKPAYDGELIDKLLATVDVVLAR